MSVGGGAAGEDMTKTVNGLVWLGSGAIVASLFTLAYTRQIPLLSPAVSRPATSTLPLTAPAITVVFVGAERCAACNDPRLQPAVRSLAATLHERAAALGHRIIMVGVSVDRDWRAGISYLDGVARFDEMVSGRGWDNVGMKYLARFPGPVATPQLVITRTSGRQAEQLLARLIGVTEIVRAAAEPKDLLTGAGAAPDR